MSTELQVFDELQSQISKYVAPVKSLVVSDKPSSEVASEHFRSLTKMKKSVEELRMKIGAPHRKFLEDAMEYSKQITAPILEMLDHIKGQQIAYEKILEKEREEQRRIEREEQRKREAEAQAAIRAQQEEAAAKIRAIQEEAEMDAMLAPKGADDSIAKAQAEAADIAAKASAEAARIEFETKKAHWDASKEIKSNKVTGTSRPWVFEIENPALVPIEFMTIDETKIRAAIRKDVRDIPGVRIFQDYRISAR